MSSTSAPVDGPGPGQELEEHDEDEEMPRLQMSRDRVLLLVVLVASFVAFLVFVVPELSGLKDTWRRLGDGDPWWIAAALALQVLAMGSYVVLFQGVHVPPGSPITLRESYLITLAGLAATRLFAAGGAGGVALTAWALRRSGMPRREVAERMIAFLVLLYGVYMAAMVVCGVGLRTGLFPGPSPFALTIVPAVFGVVGFVVFGLIATVPEDLERRLSRFEPSHPRLGPLVRRLATGPVSLSGGTRFAIAKARHPDAAMTGTIAWWALNILVLWAAFEAFGDSPTAAVLIMGYFVGLLGNLLPLPGGIGGVDAGMVGTFVAFGVNGGLALIAVLVYRLLAFWLPTIPGIVAYVQLRHTVARWRQERRIAPPSEAAIQSEVKT